jgi:anti-anti-sigma regulatory factor
MLRITLHETDIAMVIQLEGRIVGPWVEELRRTWRETFSQLPTTELALDLCNVTYADTDGIQLLKEIYTQSGAKLFGKTPWTQYLVEEVTATASTTATASR